MNYEELNDTLMDLGAEGAIMFDNPDYADAAVGVTIDNRVVYDYDKMVESLAKSDNMSIEDAVDFIDYNTIRALPYMGNEAPDHSSEILRLLRIKK